MKRLLARILSALLRRRIEAFTVFQRTVWLVSAADIIARYEDPAEGIHAVWRLALHERQHVIQQKRDGWRFYPRYFWELVRRGYDGSEYEREAIAAEDNTR